LGLNLYPDASGLVGYNGHLLPTLLAPLLALALGALLLNMDSLVGWSVLTWLGASLAVAALTGPVQPYWPALLILMPPVSLALAFVLDRLRVLLMQILGTWTLQATVYIAVGLAISAGVISWITFYQVAHTDNDLATAVGRAVRTRGDGVQVILLSGQANLAEIAQEPVVQLLSGGALVETETIQAGAWPQDLPNLVRLLVAPADHGLLPTISARYPGGEWQVARNLHANPLLYIYDIPGQSTLPKRDP
jgi:hypothetical protein